MGSDGKIFSQNTIHKCLNISLLAVIYLNENLLDAVLLLLVNLRVYCIWDKMLILISSYIAVICKVIVPGDILLSLQMV